MIPGWFGFSLASSLCCAVALHLHQRLRVPGAVTAIWVKLVAVAIALPVLVQTGMPQTPVFYVFTALAALTWCVNDLVYYRAIEHHGAALVARLTPLSIVVSFVAWFAVKPDLLARYLADPPRFAAIAAILAFAVGCAVMARRCRYNAAALKSLTAVLAAAVFGTFMVKLAVSSAPGFTGVFGYVGVEGAAMLAFYALWFGGRDRLAGRAVFAREGLRTGPAIGVLMAAGIVLRGFAQQKVDHPAYVSAVGMLEIAWLMAMARLSGWPDKGGKLAGLGIVLAAMAMAALKIH